MNKYIVQVITSALAVSFLWGALGAILVGSTTKHIGEVLLLAIGGGIATWLFIYYTFIIKEA